MGPSLSISLDHGRTALLGGTLRPPGRPMMKTKTLNYSSRFPGRYCHDVCNYYRRVVPIVRAKMDDEDERRRWVKRAASGLVLACVVGVISLGLSNGKATNQALANPPGSGSAPVTWVSRRGLDAKSAIRSLMEVSRFLSSSDDGFLLKSSHLASWTHRMPAVDPLKGPSKKKAMHKLKTGNSADAEQLLEDEYNKWKGKGDEVKLNMEMAIVEILISQEKYEEASRYDCINKEQTASGPSDPRIPLYKAIIHTATMDRNDEAEVKKAKELWDKFKESLDAEMGKPE